MSDSDLSGSNSHEFSDKISRRGRLGILDKESHLEAHQANRLEIGRVDRIHGFRGNGLASRRRRARGGQTD
ncbi:MAG: hypothetical protein JWM11_2805 [Planctomycetaceae bacterium]|nr:hypothetical protein [Planctomycetaceae bacterium]